MKLKNNLLFLFCFLPLLAGCVSMANKQKNDLFTAIKNGDSERVASSLENGLIGKGAGLNPENGNSLLVVAVSNLDSTGVRFAIEDLGANVKAIPDDGVPPVSSAIMENQITVAEYH